MHGALHCKHRSGHLRTEHTRSLFLLRRHLGNWPLSRAASTSERTAGSAWETWTVAVADGVRFARARWEIHFLLTFETAPFICKHRVYTYLLDVDRDMFYWCLKQMLEFLTWESRRIRTVSKVIFVAFQLNSQCIIFTITVAVVPLILHTKVIGVHLQLSEQYWQQYVYKPTRCTKFLWLEFIFY